MRKKILFTFTILFAVTYIYSVPAYPGLIKFTQPDGKVIEIYMKGDEKVRWAETADGYSLLFNKQGFYEYATLDEYGNMIPSGVVAMDEKNRTAEDIVLLMATAKKLTFNREQVAMMKQIWDIYDKDSRVTKSFPTTGNRKLIAILIGFTDKPFTKTQSDFNNLFNQVGYTLGGATGSVKDYYLENSYNQFNLTVDIAGPYTASQNMAYYGGNDAQGNDQKPRELFQEAINLADPDVNYSNYDNDGDGYVDGVYMIYAGYGEEAGGGANAIWAHAWALPSPVIKDGVRLQRYSCSAELSGSSGSTITRIGVICHEFGHVLGAPDYYDTNYGTNGEYDGTGNWDLMASGSWNNNGATPAHHNAYSKCYIYNWATPTVLTTAQQVTMNSAEQNQTSFYRYNTTTTNEYFLLENR